MTKDVLIRTDVGSKIGYGHGMRCLALSQRLRDLEVEVNFLMHQPPQDFQRCLRNEKLGFSKVDAEPGSEGDLERVKQLIKVKNPSWLVIDGYQFDERYCKAIFQDLPVSSFIIDDFSHLKQYFSNVILNQNSYASNRMYQRKTTDNTRMLLGTDYVLLREEFLDGPQSAPNIPKHVENILVTLGGGQSAEALRRVCMGFQHLSDLALDVHIVSRGVELPMDWFPPAGSRVKFHVYDEVDTMKSLMSRANLAIVAGGSTNWELAFMGLPAITMIRAENQVLIAEDLHKRGVVHNLGWFDQFTSEQLAGIIRRLARDIGLRKEMSKKGQELVDGRGVQRVSKVMQERI